MKLTTLNEAAKEKAVKGLGLSLTKIKTFDTCAYKYFLQYIKKEKYDQADFNPKFFKVGQFAHKWIESKINGVECKFDSETLTDEDKQKTISNCSRVFDNEYVKSILGKGQAEKEFSLYINPMESDGLEASAKFSKTADFHGYIDYYAKVGDVIHVVDWKTGSKRDLSDDTFMQLMLYAKACQKLHGGSKFVLSYYYVDMKSKNLATREFTLAELDEKIAAIVTKGVNIPKGDNESSFPAKPGWYCKYCPYSQNRSSDNTVPCKYTGKFEEPEKAAKVPT